ncbi:hypothetical protein CLOSTASPAR_05551 [[Clostridium] asparagiforme DSM 15981]|uniref:Uncharacterized protein n=1 Tax=[Clostridium] asparagiforme DSM 15981 TaxID=518636 RepID=C0D8F3_9FIRM|nr:hypothetical protein CLOSTASPAR_05551 [[Clostridium] asparagiforme DSM 15981]
MRTAAGFAVGLKLFLENTGFIKPDGRLIRLIGRNGKMKKETERRFYGFF